jgi:hypothetical protein
MALSHDGPFKQTVSLKHTQKAVGIVWSKPALMHRQVFSDLHHHRGLINRPADEEDSLRVYHCPTQNDCRRKNSRKSHVWLSGNRYDNISFA